MRYHYDDFLENIGIKTEEEKKAVKTYVKDLFWIIASTINKTNTEDD